MKEFVWGIGTNIFLLGIVSFLTDVSSEMILAILPFFITYLGGGGLAIGLVGGIGDSVSSLVQVYSGYLSDRMKKRKPFAFLGYLVSSVAKMFFPFVTGWKQLLILRPLERLGKGIRTAPRDALIASSSSREERGKAFGVHRAMDSTGAFVGAFLAFLLFFYLKTDYKSILLLSACLGFFALIPFVFIRDVPVENFVEERTYGRASLRSLPAAFKRFVAVTFIFGLANFTYMFSLLRIRNILEPSFPMRRALALPILLYCWFNITYAAFSVPCGLLCDKIGRKQTLRLGYLAYSMFCVGIVFAKSFPVIVLLFALYGVSFALIEGNQRAFATVFVEEDVRGTALGLFHTGISVATLLGNILAGIIWKYSPELTFAYGAILGFIASLGVGSIGKKG